MSHICQRWCAVARGLGQHVPARCVQAASAAADGTAAPEADAAMLDVMIAAVPKLTVAQLQEELSRRGLDTKWTPLKGKKELVSRLTVRPPVLLLPLSLACLCCHALAKESV